ncbi:non-hydrolyzing UDP-N-acetylglucosamine 2-epimerase [Bacteroides sp.]|uniref:non-hydrolyzing UDP-N-acetylglucosamine 2-epimerase n=1 Tax=Bacteroides sp. TaxID=29523 RepID=UPI00260AF398|nr:UDP-N-acetylglucosamine 2-epimerase (non-hydrolyzing) [Bacteroides sp.]MDD3038750.1 UDP-N-acetylglucosamine 2-epimerase (non-hydrolyzing) [Bacteroides sp.]
MIKILTIIGARPQIIKAAAISRAVAKRNDVEEVIVHTGQHYDQNMSEIFFDELGIPKSKYNLNVGSGSHGMQTAKMIEALENVFIKESPDCVIVYGDTNSTLAGAVTASKLHIPIAHIEAGLRSFNMSMPEEINRIACDHLSSILFAPTQVAMENLRAEGFMTSHAQFSNGKGRKVLNCGDVMYDNSIYFAQIAESNSVILSTLNIKPNGFILATIHRDNNTDNPESLNSIFRALSDISETNKQDVVLPLHPRTAKLLRTLSPELFDKVIHSELMKIIEPVSFLDMIALEKNASLVMTDSGGVQKESFFFEKPCVILRPETEWVEIVEHNAGVLTDADYEQIMDGYHKLLSKKVTFPKLFGDANAAEHILDKIIIYI